MSGGSQHNPNGRQSQLGPGWSPLQVANFLARAPQAHMASDRGVTWHTPTPPPHLYHVPAPSPPDPLQAMKSAAGNSVFRHTATPPEMYRHTPTPPDKHHMRHTPSPGDVKAAASLPPAELYAHLGPGREKLRPEDLLSYARVGVDLSLGGRSGSGSGAPSANGAASSPAAAPHPPSPALSVRDAPTINSLIARAQPRHPHARVDALLERLVPSPVSPHSVIVHSRAAPTPSPPSSNEDSADSCGAPPGSKRKRKPERTLRVPSAPLVPPPAAAPAVHSPAVHSPAATPPPPAVRVSPQETATKPLENGDAPHAQRNGPELPPTPPPMPQQESNPVQQNEQQRSPQPETEATQEKQEPQQQPDRTRRKTRSGSAETIDDIAAMIASTTGPDAASVQMQTPEPAAALAGDTDATVTVDKLKSVLASPETAKPEPEQEVRKSPAKSEDKPADSPPVEAAAAPRRRSARTSNSESTNVPVESPSEAKPAEPETSDAPTAEPTAASFVEVENQLEKMFAGLEEAPATSNEAESDRKTPGKARKRRKSAPTKGDRKAERKASRRSSRASTGDDRPRKKIVRKKSEAGKGKKVVKEVAPVKDAYDSGSNASSSRSRGPYIQIRGPRDSPLSVSVINASTGEDETEATTSRRKTGDEFRNGLRARGLHASTLGLRYDATTPDATWLCVFCERGPHASGLGDLFGPYTIDTDCEEYRCLDEASRRRYAGSTEVWFHESCAVWAPGLVAAGARLWGLAAAVWAARGARCAPCGRAGAALACAARHCRARAHLPCAPPARWRLQHDKFRALCPRHT